MSDRPSTPAVDPIHDAFAGIDSGGMALLDLSLRHGIADEEIAEMLGAPVDHIMRRRKSALDSLVTKLGRDPSGASLEQLLASITGEGEAGPPAVAELEPAPAAPKKEPATRFDLFVRMLSG